MTPNPRILITNDDGVDAPGIAIMREIAHAVSDDVWIFAPSGNKSGAGHQLTFARELEYEQRDRRTYAMPGSPADCVVVGCTHILKDKRPDIILSGVNDGQNLGDLIHCSGTAAGAREGALQGALGIAMSQAVDYEGGAGVDWQPVRRYGVAVLRALMAEARGADVFYNVNFPIHRDGDEPEIKVVPHQRFAYSPFAYYQSRNPGKFFIAIPETPRPLDRRADFETLHLDRAITVTPVLLQQTDREELARLQSRLSLRQPVEP